MLPEYDRKSLYPNTKMLSSSQFLCYEKDPAFFYERYCLPNDDTGTVKMQIGRIFSALYQNRELDYRTYLTEAKAPKRIADLFGEVITKFPVLNGGYPEYPLTTEFSGWGFRATLDDFVERHFTVIENKTGEREWTQERVNFDDQLTFQAWVHWKKYGVPPRTIILNWVNTKAGARTVLQSFKTSRSIRGLKLFEERVQTVVENLEAGNFTKNIYD